MALDIRKIYTTDPCWEQVAQAVGKEHLLNNADFTGGYFSPEQQYCHLLGCFDEDSLRGILAIEHVEFISGNTKYRLAVGTNFQAFRAGAGLVLFMHWLKQARWTLTFGGSHNFHEMARLVDNSFQVEIPRFVLNRHYTKTSGSPLALTTKRILNRTGLLNKSSRSVLKRAQDLASCKNWAAKPVREFTEAICWSEDFSGLRQSATVDYLNWRYGLANPNYQKYVVFDSNGSHQGNVVLAENTGIPRLIVAFSQSYTLATNMQSVITALAAHVNREGFTTHTEISLTCCCPQFGALLQHCGFRTSKYRRPFVVLSEDSKFPITSNIDDWHIDFDIGDNGVRYFQR